MRHHQRIYTTEMPIYVYRLEKDGNGPFNPEDEIIDEITRLPEYECKLAPFVNFSIREGDKWPQDFLFGCYSLTQLKDYFGLLLPALLKKGYKVQLYEVPYRDVRWSEPFQELAFKKNGKHRRIA